MRAYTAAAAPLASGTKAGIGIFEGFVAISSNKGLDMEPKWSVCHLAVALMMSLLQVSSAKWAGRQTEQWAIGFYFACIYAILVYVLVQYCLRALHVVGSWQAAL